MKGDDIIIYFTIKASPRHHQMTLEELWFGVEKKSIWYNPNETNTRTLEVENISDYIKSRFDIGHMIAKLTGFNAKYEELFSAERQSLYYSFHLPKKSGGFRQIDAPEQSLKEALYELKDILTRDCGAKYHTAAFAYVKGRSTVDAVKRHQANQSNWFGKYDLSNFFGSTTKEFVMQILSSIFPFSEILLDENGKKQLERALDLAFLNGGLPQGTPLSPMLTNLIMIPIDFCLSRKLRARKEGFVYTRYADDFLISSKTKFDVKEIERIIVETLEEFGAPFKINERKTRLGSRSGSNWNLGVMLNVDNEITVGHKAKKWLVQALNSYINWKKTGSGDWCLNDLQILQGHISYYKMVEGNERINKIIRQVSDRNNFDVVAAIKKDLKEL